MEPTASSQQNQDLSSSEPTLVIPPIEPKTLATPPPLKSALPPIQEVQASLQKELEGSISELEPTSQTASVSDTKPNFETNVQSGSKSAQPAQEVHSGSSDLSHTAESIREKLRSAPNPGEKMSSPQVSGAVASSPEASTQEVPASPRTPMETEPLTSTSLSFNQDASVSSNIPVSSDTPAVPVQNPAQKSVLASTLPPVPLPPVRSERMVQQNIRQKNYTPLLLVIIILLLVVVGLQVYQIFLK